MFTTDKAGILWDSIALPNAFICEYMPTSPDKYVKVYLFAMMYARFPANANDLSIEVLARELNMEQNEVLAALQYWERNRLIERVSDKPLIYKYLNVQQALMSKETMPQDEEYMQFAQALYAIFGERRKLHGGETQLCYEWVETVGLPKEVVLLMVQHLVSTRGVNFSFKSAQKFAVELAQNNIMSLDDAEQYFARSQMAWEGTRKILRRLSKFREPTIDEIDLFIKWTTKWGFSPSAIDTACKEMQGVSDPNLKYLDKILESIYQRTDREKTSAQQLQKQLDKEKEETTKIKELTKTAGISINPNVITEVYRDLNKKLPHESLLLAAKELKKRKYQSLDKLAELVDAWSDKGLVQPTEITTYLSEVRKQNRILRKLYETLGVDNQPTVKDRAALKKWKEEWVFTDDVINLVATFSAGKKVPIAFMDKILENYVKKGITTVSSAQEDHEKHIKEYSENTSKQTSKKGKSVIEQQYNQRDYNPGEVDVLTPKEIKEIMDNDT